MRTHHTTVAVCAACLDPVVDHDTDHPHPRIAATVELIHNPTLGQAIDGYFRCFVCGHDCIGSSHGAGYGDGSYVTFTEGRG